MSMWGLMELLILLGMSAFLCWFTYARFCKDEVLFMGIRPWGNKEMIAYKCTPGHKDSFGQLFRQMRDIAPDGKIYVMFYTGAKSYQDPRTFSLYAIGFPVKSDLTDWLLKGFKLFKLPEVQSAVVASYPLHHRFAESLAVRQTYPELSRYIKDRKLCAHPAIEVYDYNKKEVTFVQPLIRQNYFYVPEARALV